MQSFYCQLCQKGYTRMNDYEAHLGSYDHSHKQRLKDMKAMVRDPNAAARARRQEAKADGVISIKLGEAGGSAGGSAGGFKKGGFKKSGFKAAFPSSNGSGNDKKEDTVTKAEPELEEKAPPRDQMIESDTEDEGYEVYDPRHPTD